jgi:hypothetical protein
MKSGGSSSAPKTTAQPTNSTTTAYGNATPTNPAWTSYLPSDTMASAQLGDPTVQRYSDGSEAPSTATLLPATDATASTTTASSSDGISSSMRKFLAEMMMRAERDKYLSRVNKESASGGSKASGSFGGSSGGLY